MEREKEQENERFSLTEFYKNLIKDLCVFPTQVITEKSFPLEKELVLNRLEVLFSLMKKRFSFYWRRARDSSSRER